MIGCKDKARGSFQPTVGHIVIYLPTQTEQTRDVVVKILSSRGCLLCPRYRRRHHRPILRPGTMPPGDAPCYLRGGFHYLSYWSFSRRTAAGGRASAPEPSRRICTRWLFGRETCRRREQGRVELSRVRQHLARDVRWYLPKNRREVWHLIEKATFQPASAPPVCVPTSWRLLPRHPDISPKRNRYKIIVPSHCKQLFPLSGWFVLLRKAYLDPNRCLQNSRH